MMCSRFTAVVSTRESVISVHHICTLQSFPLAYFYSLYNWVSTVLPYTLVYSGQALLGVL